MLRRGFFAQMPLNTLCVTTIFVVSIIFPEMVIFKYFLQMSSLSRPCSLIIKVSVKLALYFILKLHAELAWKKQKQKTLLVLRILLSSHLKAIH